MRSIPPAAGQARRENEERVSGLRRSITLRLYMLRVLLAGCDVKRKRGKDAEGIGRAAAGETSGSASAHFPSFIPNRAGVPEPM